MYSIREEVPGRMQGLGFSSLSRQERGFKHCAVQPWTFHGDVQQDGLAPQLRPHSSRGTEPVPRPGRKFAQPPWAEHSRPEPQVTPLWKSCSHTLRSAEAQPHEQLFLGSLDGPGSCLIPCCRVDAWTLALGWDLLPGAGFASVDGTGVNPYKDCVPTGCPRGALV